MLIDLVHLFAPVGAVVLLGGFAALQESRNIRDYDNIGTVSPCQDVRMSGWVDSASSPTRDGPHLPKEDQEGLPGCWV